VKALLASVLGLVKMEGVLQSGGLTHLLGGGLDGTPFDIHRSQTWAALRSEYPTHMGHESLRGPTIDDTETLLGSIKSELEDVVGLISSLMGSSVIISSMQWTDTIKMNRVQEQGGEVQRTDKHKKLQAVVAVLDAMTPIVQQTPPHMNLSQTPLQTPSPLVQQPQSQGSPAPSIVYIDTQNREKGANNTYKQKQNNQYSGPQGQSEYGQLQKPPNQLRKLRKCWLCGQEDHSKRDCPRLF